MTRNVYDPLKRAIDVVGAAVLLLVSAPIQLVVGLFVRQRLGTPVFFRQRRPGRNEVIFEVIKFRSMLDYDESAGLMTDAQRMTPFGSWLRSTSLDELPTFWNVLKGEMSLVGPRPLLPEYLALYSERQRRRHEVRPGVTGMAQTQGRNQIEWPRKLDLDVQYVENRSLRLDIGILLHTVRRVLAREGISDGLGPTSDEFRGNSHYDASLSESASADNDT